MAHWLSLLRSCPPVSQCWEFGILGAAVGPNEYAAVGNVTVDPTSVRITAYVKP